MLIAIIHVDQLVGQTSAMLSLNSVHAVRNRRQFYVRPQSVGVQLVTSYAIKSEAIIS